MLPRFTGCITVRLVTVICSTFLFTIVIIVSTPPPFPFPPPSILLPFFYSCRLPLWTAVHPIDGRVFSSGRMIQIARAFAICDLYRLTIKLYVCYFTIIFFYSISLLFLAIRVFSFFSSLTFIISNSYIDNTNNVIVEYIKLILTRHNHKYKLFLYKQHVRSHKLLYNNVVTQSDIFASRIISSMRRSYYAHV